MDSGAGPAAITIASWGGRFGAIVLVPSTAVLAISIPFDKQHWWQWAKHIPTPVPAVVAYLAVVAFASIWLLCQGCRLGARFDDHGVAVRRLLRTVRYSWPEVSHFADGYRESEGGRFWALDIVLSGGRTVTVIARERTNANPKTLAAIRQVAERYQIPAELTGIPRERDRPSARPASVGRLPSEYAPYSEVDGAVLAAWVETREFSVTRLRPGYDKDEFDAFLIAIRDAFLGTREPSLTPDEIRNKQFSTTRLRAGYDEEEIDAFLDEAELRLAAQVSTRYGPSAAHQQPVAADPPTGAAPVRCLECGAQSAEATEVCARCGAPIILQPPAAADPAAREAGDSIASLAGGAPHQLAGQRAKPAYSRRNALVLAGVGLVTLAAVATVIVTSNSSVSSTPSSSLTPSALQLTEDQLRPGDCLLGSGLSLNDSSLPDNSNPWPDLFEAVPCNKQHIAEVFLAGNVWPQPLAYPGDGEIWMQADGRCGSAFQAYVAGRLKYITGFTYDMIYPDNTSWPSGDRLLVCVAYKWTSQYPGGAPVDYSIRGSNQ